MYFGVKRTFQSKLSSRLCSLEALIDDRSPLVREAVIREINRLGEPAFEWLEALVLGPDIAVANAAEAILSETAAPDAEAAFRRYMRGSNLDLEQGAILLHRSIHPRLDPAKLSGALDAMALRVQDLIAIPTTPPLVVRALNRVLFHELGYRSEANADPDPGTVLLGDVLALRRGVNLSLAWVYMLVARRLGMAFQPIVLPNHVLLAFLRDREPFVIDPFSRGRFFSWDEVQAILPVGVMLDVQQDPTRLTKRLLLHSCERLAGIYSMRGERDRAATFAGFCEEFGETSRQSRTS